MVIRGFVQRHGLRQNGMQEMLHCKIQTFRYLKVTLLLSSDWLPWSQSMTSLPFFQVWDVPLSHSKIHGDSNLRSLLMVNHRPQGPYLCVATGPQYVVVKWALLLGHSMGTQHTASSAKGMPFTSNCFCTNVPSLLHMELIGFYTPWVGDAVLFVYLCDGFCKFVMWSRSMTKYMIVFFPCL